MLQDVKRMPLAERRRSSSTSETVLWVCLWCVGFVVLFSISALSLWPRFSHWHSSQRVLVVMEKRDGSLFCRGVSM